MEQHISTKQVCLLLGISLSTFYRYCKAGLLKPTFLTFGKHRRFSLSQLRQSFNLDNDAVLSLCYSRVSSHDQKNDLISQENKLLNFGKTLVLSIDSFNPFFLINEIFLFIISIFILIGLIVGAISIFGFQA